MFRGAPIEQGTIQFHPTETTKNPGVGTLASGGRFSQISTYGRYDGVAIGTHKVTIASSFDEPVEPWPAIPRAYMSANTTPWTVEVVEEADKNVFELVVEEKDKLKR